MARISLRSPYFFTRTALATAQSVLCEIRINNSLKYSLLKSATAGLDSIFEISELCRDFLTLDYDGTPTVLGETYIDIDLSMYFYASKDGSGSALNPVYSQDNNEGYDAYGYFNEGANPEMPFYLNGNDSFLISPKLGSTTEWEIFAPVGQEGFIPFIFNTGLRPIVDYKFYNSGATSVSIGAVSTCVINRIPCSKYGDGERITFVNKYGQYQDLWFSLKKVLTTSTTKETYQGINLTSSGAVTTYATNKPSKVVYNKEATERISLNSGYYPEGYNAVFEQLLESEQVWIRTVDAGGTTQYLPLNVITSSFVKKTKLNDRLINYTIEFSEAYDKINNIR